MHSSLCFQCCQKLIVFNQAEDAILLARRQGEADHNNMFTFIGGKLEVLDGGLLAGLQREKNEEIGKQAVLRVCTGLTYPAYFVKKDGSAMVLPHYLALYMGGAIRLSNEYAEYKWVKLDELTPFEPKLGNIEEAVAWARRVRRVVHDQDFAII